MTLDQHKQKSQDLARLKFKEETKRVDRFFYILLLAHIPFALLMSFGYGTWKFVLSSSLIIAVLSSIGFQFGRGQYVLRILNALLLMTWSGILIQAQYGRI